MFNINEFTTNTPVLAIAKAMHDIRANIEASFEDQLFIALLAAVQGKGSDASSVYLGELLTINAHTKKCLIDESLVESLAKKGFLSAIRKNRTFWCDVLQGNILKIESEGKINDMRAKLGMHNKSLLELCLNRLEQEKAENAEKLVQAEKQAKLKEEKKAKRLTDKKQAEAKKAQEEYQQELEQQSKQLQVVDEQVQAKLADLASPNGILGLIESLEDDERQTLLAALATKYPKTTTAPKRGKAEADQQATLIS